MLQNSIIRKGFLLLVAAIFFCPLLAQPTFINYQANKIILPADSSRWYKLAENISRGRSNPHTRISFLHIGDSHIQGDYFTGEVRDVLFHSLNAISPSRGLTFPYRLVKTNGPDCFSSHCDSKLIPASVRKTPSQFFTLTGYKFTTCDSLTKIRIRDTAGYAFNCIYLFHSPVHNGQITLNGIHSSGEEMLGDSLVATRFDLDKNLSEAEIEIRMPLFTPGMQVYGLYYFNQQNPWVYNAVGVNGATFQTLLQIKGNAEMIRFLHPDCVILSYGTNESIDRTMDSTQLKSRIRQSIQMIRSVLPDVPILFTTPGDHLVKRKYVNQRIGIAAAVIRRTALENNCACWDFYRVMGGPGSVKAWYHNHLVFVDWIHLSKKGYKLQGDLFAEAWLKLIQELNFSKE